jgi:hypothetical protein
MKVAKGALIFLMVAVMIVAAGQMALASRTGTQAPGADLPITIDPRFQGTTVDAVVGLIYEKAGDPDACPEVLGPAVKMTIAMMLEIDRNNFIPYGDVAWNLCYWDFDAQDVAFHNMVREKVLPDLYSRGFTKVQDACFAIKSIEAAVDDKDGDFCADGTPIFSLLKMTLAIDTKTSCPPPGGP